MNKDKWIQYRVLINPVTNPYLKVCFSFFIRKAFGKTKHNLAVVLKEAPGTEYLSTGS